MVARIVHLFSHGMSEWLLVRLSAMVMTFYTAVLAVILLYIRPDSYKAWHNLFESQFLKLGTFVFMLTLLLHAWIGVQDVLSDYVKSPGLGIALTRVAATVLLALGGWSLQILWGSAA